MNQAKHVASRFGEMPQFIEACAKLSPPLPASTVYSWTRSGTIPERYWLPLLMVSRQMKKRLRPTDFVAHLADAFAEAIAAADSGSTETSSDLLASQATPA